jgi:hypothetical protein
VLLICSSSIHLLSIKRQEELLFALSKRKKRLVLIFAALQSIFYQSSVRKTDDASAGRPAFSLFSAKEEEAIYSI